MCRPNGSPSAISSASVSGMRSRSTTGTSPTRFRGLVQPTDSERTLNGYRLKQPRAINATAQLAKAIAAFQGNQIIMLVDDRQVESLDEEITLRPNTRVSFLRLTPLVGG
jgi:hypothetical protein